MHTAAQAARAAQTKVSADDGRVGAMVDILTVRGFTIN